VQTFLLVADNRVSVLAGAGQVDKTALGSIAKANSENMQAGYDETETWNVCLCSQHNEAILPDSVRRYATSRARFVQQYLLEDYFCGWTGLESLDFASLVKPNSHVFKTKKSPTPGCFLSAKDSRQLAGKRYETDHFDDEKCVL
jgi:hypothetical protein